MVLSEQRLDWLQRLLLGQQPTKTQIQGAWSELMADRAELLARLERADRMAAIACQVRDQLQPIDGHCAFCDLIDKDHNPLCEWELLDQACAAYQEAADA